MSLDRKTLHLELQSEDILDMVSKYVGSIHPELIGLDGNLRIYLDASKQAIIVDADYDEVNDGQ